MAYPMLPVPAEAILTAGCPAGPEDLPDKVCSTSLISGWLQGPGAEYMGTFIGKSGPTFHGCPAFGG